MSFLRRMVVTQMTESGRYRRTESGLRCKSSPIWRPAHSSRRLSASREPSRKPRSSVRSSSMALAALYIDAATSRSVATWRCTVSSFRSRSSSGESTFISSGIPLWSCHGGLAPSRPTGGYLIGTQHGEVDVVGGLWSGLPWHRRLKPPVGMGRRHSRRGLLNLAPSPACDWW